MTPRFASEREIRKAERELAEQVVERVTPRGEPVLHELERRLYGAQAADENRTKRMLGLSYTHGKGRAHDQESPFAMPELEWAGGTPHRWRWRRPPFLVLPALVTLLVFGIVTWSYYRIGVGALGLAFWVALGLSREEIPVPSATEDELERLRRLYVSGEMTLEEFDGALGRAWGLKKDEL